MSNRINSPHHYTQGDIECIQAIEAALGDEGALAYCRGSAMKYLWRCMYKKSTLKDLQKAQWYIQRAQQYVGKEPTPSDSHIFCRPRMSDRTRYEEAVKVNATQWIDSTGRSWAIANPPEGDDE